jgi:hypothetical protein
LVQFEPFSHEKDKKDPNRLQMSYGSCWRKISTSRQAHSKPKEACLTHVMNPEARQSIFLKLTME